MEEFPKDRLINILINLNKSNKISERPMLFQQKQVDLNYNYLKVPETHQTSLPNILNVYRMKDLSKSIDPSPNY
jgi:hypothetical protein